MMLKKTVCLVLVVLVALCSSGCWDAIDITDKKIITLVGVDYRNGFVRILLEYPRDPNPDQQGQGSGSYQVSKVAVGEGRTLIEAKDSYTNTMQKDIFIGGIRALVFSKSYAQMGIMEYLNRLRGMREYRKTVNVFTTTSDMDTLMDSQLQKTNSVGFFIEHMGQQTMEEGVAKDNSISRVLEDVATPNTGFYLDNLDLVKNRITRTGYSVFKDIKMVGLIPIEDTQGINFLVIPKAEGQYMFQYKGVDTSISVLLEDRKIEPIYYSDGSISLHVKIKCKCEIMFMRQIINLTEDDFQKLGEMVAGLMKQDMEKAVRTSQNVYGCDYLYFYKYFRAKYGSLFDSLNWNEQYKTAQFSADVIAKVHPGNAINYDLKGK